jgi:cyclopropane fatty-acyl-phospholipid synthase-like methyltransferase
MRHRKTAKDVFEAWGRDYHADGMETEHWPRARQIFDLIEPSDGNYLEVGVGNGYGLAYMATHQFANGQCLGMDLSASMVERTRERTNALANVAVETGDFLTWDFGGRRFDAIFSMEVFYYFADINAGIHKARSILNPGGTLWVAVNFYEENEQSADWPDRLGTPMQRWSTRDYVNGFERAGFKAVEQRMIAAPVPEGSEHGDAPTLLTFGTRP